VALILDTSVLFASLDASDRDHDRSRVLIGESQELLLIPSPVLPEVDYLVRREGRPDAMLGLLADIASGVYVMEDLAHEDYTRVSTLIDTYRDAGIGFVDAAIVAVVERLGERKLATLDHRHFSVVRPRHVDALELVP
jgi:predicted nucleic acid-binding protein